MAHMVVWWSALRTATVLADMGGSPFPGPQNRCFLIIGSVLAVHIDTSTSLRGTGSIR